MTIIKKWGKDILQVENLHQNQLRYLWQTARKNIPEGVLTQKEVEDFYNKFDTKGNAPSWGLNSKLLKDSGKIIEKVWKVGGMYSAAIEKIVGWLEKAVAVAENAEQKKG